MHQSVRDWVSLCVTAFECADGDTLEVGSRNVNGTVRDLFTGLYIGVDTVAGDGVDRVAAAKDVVDAFGEQAFDTVVCCEMLEHDKEFWQSLPAMGRVLRPGGRLLLTTRGIGFKKHAEPDYWRFSLESAPVLAACAGLFLSEAEEDPQQPGIFMVGVRQ